MSGESTVISAEAFVPVAVPVQSKVPILVGPEVSVTSMEPSVPLQTDGGVPTAAITVAANSETTTVPVVIQPRLSACNTYVPTPTLVASATGVVPSDSK